MPKITRLPYFDKEKLLNPTFYRAYISESLNKAPYNALYKEDIYKTDFVKEFISHSKMILCPDAHYNIVLIGMPSCGKTTIGTELSHLLKKEFIDFDEEIVKTTHHSIPELFSLYKEEGFRHIESIVCEKLSKKENCILSTGGGIIKRIENIEQLQENGLLLFIDRDLKHLASSDLNRPLSSSKEAVEALYQQRYPCYLEYADFLFKNNNSLTSIVKRIYQTCK